MPEPADDRSRGGSPVREIVLPLAVVLGLVGNAWWGGMGWGKVSSQLDVVLTSLASLQGRTGAAESRLTELETWKRVHEKEQEKRDQEFRLFKLYTKGRIARLPYRASDDGE